MFEYETYTTRTPLAPAVTRNQVLSTLVPAELLSSTITPSPLEIRLIDATEYEPILSKSDLTTSTKEKDKLRSRGQWFHLTETTPGTSSPVRIVYACFIVHDGESKDPNEAEGLSLHSYIPLGLEVILRYSIEQSDDFRTGRSLTLVQHVKMRCHVMFTSFTKEAIELQRQKLATRMSEKAQFAEWSKDMDAMFNQ